MLRAKFIVCGDAVATYTQAPGETRKHFDDELEAINAEIYREYDTMPEIELAEVGVTV